jgi:PadR family transcriptional regulator PadR
MPGDYAREKNAVCADGLWKPGETLDKCAEGMIPSDYYPSDLGIMAKPNSAQSALDLLVLTILSRRGPTHGYGIANAIQEVSEDALRVDEGSLYPALHRMEEAGWISAEWMITENKRRARIYRISRGGLKQLTAEQERWIRFSAGVARVIRYA